MAGGQDRVREVLGVWLTSRRESPSVLVATVTALDTADRRFAGSASSVSAVRNAGSV